MGTELLSFAFFARKTLAISFLSLFSENQWQTNDHIDPCPSRVANAQCGISP